MRQKIEEIWELWPLLRKELIIENKAMDYVELTFANQSTFCIVSMASSARGERSTAGVVEEGILIDQDDFNEIVLPMMSVNRQDELGRINERENQQAQIFVTSAGPKTCFMYEKLIDLVVTSVIKPELAFVWGGDYRLPVAMGLLNKSFLEEQRMSPTFRASSFAREYMSILRWTKNFLNCWNPFRAIATTA